MKSTLSSSEWLSEPDVHEGDANIDQSYPHAHMSGCYVRPALAQMVDPTVVSRLVRKSVPGLTPRKYH